MTLIELQGNKVMALMALGRGISLIDSYGNVYDSEVFWSDSTQSLGAIRKRSPNEFYFSTGYRQDGCSSPGSPLLTRNNPAIGKMDSLGNVTSLHHYRLNGGCLNHAGDLEITSDKSIIVWGSESRFFVLRTDSTMAPVWAKRFAEAGSFRFIKELPNGDLLAGFDLPTAGASVARLDPDGNFIWCKSYMRPSG